MTEAAIDVQGLRITYRGAVDDAVRGVDLRVEQGEILAIVGESGSGKSSIASALLGLHEAGTRVHAEQLRLFGHELRDAGERRWRAVRRELVSLVPQDPLAGLNPAMRVGAQVREALMTRQGPAEDNRQVLSILRDAGLSDPERFVHRYPHELSGGQRQRILIGIALAGAPRLIIADEPTSALDVTVQRRILDHLEMLVRERNITLVLITHDLALAAERADRVLVLHDGQIAEQGAADALMTSPRSAVTQSLLAAAPSFSPSGDLICGRLSSPSEQSAGEPLLSFHKASKIYGAAGEGAPRAVDDVTLEVFRGETLGIVGESGSGKSTLLRLALGLITPVSGTVLYDGVDLAVLSRAQLRSFRRRFQLVQQDPTASLDPRYTIARCISEPLEAARIGTRSTRRRRVDELLELVRLPLELRERYPRQLSGGQRQRVAIARALAAEPETIYLDEPVSALDVTVQHSILATLVDIQERLGVTLVFVSHDLAVIAQISHRVAVMRSGRLVELGPAPTVLGAPRTDYTRELIAAVPRFTGDEGLRSRLRQS